MVHKPTIVAVYNRFHLPKQVPFARPLDGQIEITLVELRPGTWARIGLAEAWI